MPVDAGIYGQFAQPVRSVQDYQQQYQAADQRNLGLQQNRLNIQQAQALMAQREGLRSDVQSGQIDLMNPAHRNALMSKYPDIAPTLLDQIDKGAVARATAAKDTAQAGHYTAQTGQVNQQTVAEDVQREATSVMANPTLENARASVIKLASKHQGMYDPTPDLVQLSQLQSPEQIKQWAAGHALKAQELLPKTGNVNLGGTEGFTSTNPVTGAVTMTGNVPITESANNAATNAAHLKGIGITQAGENLRAGVTPGGGLSPDMESTAKAIAAGQLPAPTGMALLNPRNQRVLGRVMEINPSYDFTDVSAKNAAAKAFTSGQQGNALRSVATANVHLEQLGELADALQNGNMQVINRVSNWYRTNTGNPAPTNFDAVKNIIGQEVVKAIVAGGGSAGEREEAAKAFSTASSPSQLKGAIEHYRMVMGAQQQNLLEQRRAAGLSDSTLPKYSQGSQKGAGSDIQSQADAILSRGK
jgi:hypothetical protein